MIQRLWAVLRKEFAHILRDPRTLLVVLAMPLAQLLLMANAVSLDVHSTPIAVVDLDHSPASRAFIRELSSSFFRMTEAPRTTVHLDRLFRGGAIDGIVVIPQHFERDLVSRPAVPVQVLVDGSDANTATLVTGFVNAVAERFSLRGAPGSGPPIALTTRLLYNPEGNTLFFIVPGLAGLILTLVSTLLTSLALVREKESGTLEQILVSPLSPLEIILGKVGPYFVLALADGLLILAAAVTLYQLPIRGSLPLLLVLMLPFVLAYLALGLLISSGVATQTAAVLVSLGGTMLPNLILSNLIFPIASMPRPLQLASLIVPGRYFLDIIRGVVIKGVGISDLIPQTVFLCAFSAVMLVISIKSFRERLG